MKVLGVSWAGVKTDAYDDMVAFFGRVLGLQPAHEATDFTVFVLPDGDKLEVFGPRADHPVEQFARDRVVVGLLVDDLDAATEKLTDAGVELIGERRGRVGGYAWQHFRAPDGTVLEVACDPRHR